MQYKGSIEFLGSIHWLILCTGIWKINRNLGFPKSKGRRISTKSRPLQLASSVEVLQSNLHTLAHGLLTLANPHTGIEVLLVGLVLAVGVADSAHEVVLLVENVVTDTRHVGVLHIGVEVDLDDTVADRLLVFLLGGTRAPVEDEVDGLVLVGADLLLDVGLVLAQKLGVQTDVAGLVDTVHITETSGNGEVGADGGESVVDGQDVLGLSVQGVVVNVLVVDTVLLTTSDTDFLNRVLADAHNAR